jgi:MFS family permease
MLGSVAFLGNLFVAPASFFQNRYLDEVRGYSGGGISLFTLVTSTPFGLGVLAGGYIADRRGRRLIGATSLVVGSGLVVVSFGVAGMTMWASALVGGIVLGATVPSLGVYQTELFSTGRRSLSAYLVTLCALLSGGIGLVATGMLLDHGFSHVRVLGVLALGQLAVAAIVLLGFPETAHLELEDINPEDAPDLAELRAAEDPSATA